MVNQPCPPNGDNEKKENMEKRKEELQAVIEKQDDRSKSISTSHANNYYFVFQGILLGAIINATTVLRCSDHWFLFSLSLIAAVLNLVSFLVIGSNYKRNVLQRHQTKIERNKLESDLVKLETSPSDHGLKSNILSYWTSTIIEGVLVYACAKFNLVDQREYNLHVLGPGSFRRLSLSFNERKSCGGLLHNDVELASGQLYYERGQVPKTFFLNGPVSSAD
ncbi:unnamed protein product [Prunus brigantina]